MHCTLMHSDALHSHALACIVGALMHSDALACIVGALSCIVGSL